MSSSNGWGGKRLGAGAPRKSREDHIREGTYIEARHGRTLWDELDAREWSEEEWTARVKRALRDGEARLYESADGQPSYGLTSEPLPAGAKLMPASSLAVAAQVATETA
ncbi:MAG TPA: hypothetical protein VIM33_08610 [Gaiellaceae bacterium]